MRARVFRRRAGGAAAVATVVIAVAMIALGLGFARTGSRALVGRGFGSVPLPARAAVSAALGRDDPDYRVIGLRARNPAQRLGVAFSRAGVTVVSGPAWMRLALTGFGYASAVQSIGAAVPRAAANRVEYARTGFREWYVNGPLGLEQGFDVAAAPRAGTGPLTLAMALSGRGRARPDGRGGVLLSRGGAELRYGGLVVSDARGRTLPAWLALSGRRLLVRVDDRGARYPLRVDPFIQQAQLTAADGGANDQLGYSVAVSGNTIVAGAGNHSSGQGAVYVFVMPAGGWRNATQTAELTASDGGASDRLGSSVAVSGNTIVAGASYHTVSGHSSQGAAYVFVMPPGGWANATQTAELTASDGHASDYLGGSVAVSGNTIVAGAQGHAIGSNSSQGAAYVFVMPPGGWANATQTAELTAPDGGANDSLGVSVAVSGNTVVAGPYTHQVGANSAQGAAYVFVMPPSGWGTAWPLTAELTATDGAANDGLGYSVAVSGNTVVAGSPHHTVGGNSVQGAAYVFVMPPGGWANATQTAELTASDGNASDNLGFSVAVSGNAVVASSPYRTVGSNGLQGAAYVFVMPPGGWTNATQTAELTVADGNVNDHLAWSVGVSGNTVIAGAPYRTVGANSSQGAAYAFARPPASITIASPANSASYTQGQSVAASYSCTAPTGATITACTGPVASGQPIDTRTLGQHTFTVNATTSDGATTTESVTYGVAATPTPTPTPTSPAVVTKLMLVGTPTPAHASVSFSLTCQAAPGGVCRGVAQLTTLETLRRAKIVALSAKHNQSTHNTRRVTVGSTSFSLAAGQAHKIVVALNAAGRRLLARLGRIPATLTITLLNTDPPTVLTTIKTTIKAKKPKPKHHA